MATYVKCQQTLALINQSEKFDSDNSGHNALLICEIVRLCYPILLSEIEMALMALKISMGKNDVFRHLYLVSKFQLINKHSYSSYQYYFPTSNEERKIKLANAAGDQVVDPTKIRMSIRQTFISSTDNSSVKRKTALKQITQKLSGDTK